MILEHKDVLQIILHRAPFIMVGDLIEASEEGITTSFTVNEGNILCEANCFSYPGLIENIAQSCAAGLGYISKEKDEPAKIGFIGAISKLKTYSKPKINAEIITKVKVIQDIYNVLLIKGECFLGDEKLIECEMKVVIAE